MVQVLGQVVREVSQVCRWVNWEGVGLIPVGKSGVGPEYTVLKY